MNDDVDKRLRGLRIEDNGIGYIELRNVLPGGAVHRQTLRMTDREILRAHRHALVDLDVPLADLIGTQPAVREDHVRKLIDEPNCSRIVLLGWRGKTFLIDGHHRAAAAVLRGEATIRARCYYAQGQPS